MFQAEGRMFPDMVLERKPKAPLPACSLQVSGSTHKTGLLLVGSLVYAAVAIIVEHFY